MERAMWNGASICALNVAKTYDTETKVRVASQKGELCCPDPNCSCVILKYCHGEKKRPYFAHKNQGSCDYAKFDSQNNDVIRTVCSKISSHLQLQGYQIEYDVKTLPHHYAHLLVSLGNIQLAIELIDKTISVEKVLDLEKQYQTQNIDVQWIVIGETDHAVEEKHTYFSHRHCLNRFGLLIINAENLTIMQQIDDPNPYTFRGKEVESKNYPPQYIENEYIDKLVIENNRISIKGFNGRYQSWLEKKKRKFEEKCKQMELDSIDPFNVEKRGFRTDWEKQADNINGNPVTRRNYCVPQMSSDKMLKMQNEELENQNQKEKQAQDARQRPEEITARKEKLHRLVSRVDDESET